MSVLERKQRLLIQSQSNFERNTAVVGLTLSSFQSLHDLFRYWKRFCQIHDGTQVQHGGDEKGQGHWLWSEYQKLVEERNQALPMFRYAS